MKPVDAVFHRDFARYRHLPYPDSETDGRPDFMVRTWINVIMREELPDEIRLILFPERFDLGHTNSDNDQAAKLADLIAEINSGVGDLQGEKLSGVTKKDLQTTLDGIKNTIGCDVSNSKLDYPTSSLKVIKLLYEMTKSRKSHLFGLIEPPHLGTPTPRLGTPTPQFMDAAPDLLNEDDTLIFSDLVSYLSIEIPDERLDNINKHILTYHELLQRIAHENIKITEPIRTCHHGDSDRIAAKYQDVTKKIEQYQPVSLSMPPIPLDEALYIYLRTLSFRHFVGAYEGTVEKSTIEKPINEITDEMNDFCSLLSEEVRLPISPHTAVVSINGFSSLVRRYEKKLRGIVESATGLYVRRKGFEEVISHAGKVLSIHIWRLRRTKDLDAVVISIADCIAALCAVRHQQNVSTPYVHHVHGQKPAGTGTLKSFAKNEGVVKLQETDYIPQSASQLMLLRFGRIHSYIIGHGDRRAETWSQFQLARLKKYVRIFQSYDIDAIIFSVRRLNRYCESVVEGLISSNASN